MRDWTHRVFFGVPHSIDASMTIKANGVGVDVFDYSLCMAVAWYVSLVLYKLWVALLDKDEI